MSLLDDLQMSDFLDHEGVDYRLVSGSSGEQLNIQECPVCGNRKWKVYLNADNGLGNCFVCSSGFNRWTFIAAQLGTEDKSLIRRKLNEVSRGTSYAPKAKRLEVFSEIASALMPLSLELPDNEGKNSPYLEARGITGHYAGRFKLRWCRYGSHKYKTPDGERTQKFDDRIIIPILDLHGELVTFQGRDITGDAERKYLFPAQLPATGRFLYNGHEAMALKAKHIIMNEGAFDVIPTAIACDIFPELHGVVPVGSFGKKLSTSTNQQPSQVDALLTLKRQAGLQSVTMMWDGEVAALTSALDACRLIRGVGLEARIALLPKGKDPNEVDARIIATAYLSAKTYSRLLDTRWRIQNPYA